MTFERYGKSSSFFLTCYVGISLAGYSGPTVYGQQSGEPVDFWHLSQEYPYMQCFVAIATGAVAHKDDLCHDVF